MDIQVAQSVDTDFIHALFDGLGGYIEVREIGGGKPKSRFFRSVDELESYLPPDDANVYVGIFTRSKARGTADNCKSTMAVWADYDDGAPLHEIKARINAVGIPYPSVLVSSGHGIHAYWLLDKPAAREVLPVLKTIAERTGADSRVADVARVMRLPNTWNVKGEPVLCEVLERNNRRHYLSTIVSSLGLRSKASPQRQIAEIEELAGSNMACLHLIAKGVGKGQRNFALGKIVSYLKLKGFDKRRALEVCRKWNGNNDPEKPDGELTSEFHGYWQGDYKYLGCKFSNEQLQQVNEQLCPMDICEYHKKQKMQVIDDEEASPVDNYIFKDSIYPKVRGLDLAVHAFVAKAGVITRERLAAVVERHEEDKKFNESIKKLVSYGFVKIEKGVRQRGIPDRIIFTDMSNYGRGYTLLNPLLCDLFIAKKLNDNEYKLMCLLKYYSFGKVDVWPTIETLSLKMGISSRSGSRLILGLEQKHYLKRNYTMGKGGMNKLSIQLQF